MYSYGKPSQHYFARVLMTICFGSLLLFLIPLVIDGQWHSILSQIPAITAQRWHDVAVIFSAIVLETFPFVLLGSLISSTVEAFVPTSWILKIIPEGVAGIISASLLGMIIPVCDCGTAPIVRKLLEHGRGYRVVTAFMLSSPTVNPVTLISTYYAFGDIRWPAIRVVTGVLIAWLVSFCMTNSPSPYGSPLTKTSALDTGNPSEFGTKRNKNAGKAQHLISHTLLEFYNVMPALVFSACVTSLVQVFLPLRVLLTNGTATVIVPLSMMLLAAVFSLCSQADAFVARSFTAFVPNNGMLTFMLAGQMIDLRSIMVFSGIYTKKRMIRMVTLASAAIFTVGLVLTKWR